jgi:ATP-dependent Lhr-like helicase
MEDSLQEAHDLEGLRRVLEKIERGEIELVARDTREPSPFCYELLNADPYAFLDGGEIAERRTRAVATRRSLTVESVGDLGRLDPEAMERVRQEARPLVRTADELHDVLLSRIVVPAAGDGGDPGRSSVEAGECGSGGVGELTDGARSLSLPRSSTPLLPHSDTITWTHLYTSLASDRRATTLRRPGRAPLWAAAERLPAALAAFPDAVADPPLAIPEGVRRDWSPEEARVAMVRGLMEVCGPITSAQVAGRLGIEPSQADACLEALEGEGVVLRGKFTNPRSEIPNPKLNGESASAGSEICDAPEVPAAPAQVEWCHRRLLARIHRLTMEGLRKQIEPVTVDVFQRYLTRHHGLLPGSKRAGTSGLFETLAMLQGLDLPAVVWERDVLSARVEKYRPEWLDELCLTGEVGWGRLFPTKRVPDRSRPLASLTRVVPMALFLRDDLEWLQVHASEADLETLSSPARQVYSLLEVHGAMFAADLISATRMLAAQLNDVLGELVSQGLVTADGFAGLRALLSARSSAEEPARSRPRLVRRRAPLAGSGRWSLWRRGGGGEVRSVVSRSDGVEELRSRGVEEYPSVTPPLPNSSTAPFPSAETDTHLPARPESSSDVAAHWAWQLLRRWGVVFRDLLEREPGAPRWFELLQVLRRLEARGEIRGGRFILGVAGEQFALGDTVRLLRQLRDEGPKQELVIISAADPLNLAGVLTAHDRVPANASNRIAYLDGVPVAALVAREICYFAEPTDALRKLLQDGRLLRRHSRAAGEGEAEETNGAGHAPPPGTPADAGPSRRRAQKSLFPTTIPRPFIR